MNPFEPPKADLGIEKLQRTVAADDIARLASTVVFILLVLTTLAAAIS